MHNIDSLANNYVEKILENLQDRSQENLRLVLKSAFLAGADTERSLNENSED